MRSVFASFLMLLLLSLSASLRAQPQADSLLAAVRTLPNDTTKAYQMVMVASQLVRNAPEKARTLAEEALILAEDLQYPRAQAGAYNILGAIDMMMGDADEAFANMNQALQVCNSNHLRDVKVATLRNLGNLFADQSDTVAAILNYTKAIQTSIEIGDSLGLAKTLLNMANMESRQGASEKALANFRRAAAIFVAKKELQLQAVAYNNIANEYIGRQQYDSATLYCNKALLLRQQTRDIRGMGFLHLSLSQIAESRMKPDSALIQVKQAIVFFRQVDKGTTLAGALAAEARLLRETGHPKEALAPIQEAHTLLKTTSNAGQMVDVLLQQEEIYLALKDTTRALISLNDAHNLAQINNLNRLVAVSNLRVAELSIERGKYPTALERLEANIKLNTQATIPTQLLKETYTLLIDVYEALKQPENARKIRQLLDAIPLTP